MAVYGNANYQERKMQVKKKVHHSIKILLLTLMLTFLVGGLAVSAAGSFHISLKKATINIGDDSRLELEVEGLTADDKKPRWNSWNENIAKVDQEGERGIVTALSKGKAIISSGIGFPREICTVTVVEPSIKLNKTAASIYYGSKAEDCTSIQLKASVKGANKDIVWSSSNEAVATVDAMGKVIPKAAGRAAITARANGKTSVCNITVLDNRLSLNIGKMQLSTKGTGSSVKLLPTVIGASKKIAWESDNPAVAVVKGGKVTGKSAGTAKITATANGVKAECEVTVIEGLLSINEEHAVLYVTKTGAGTNQGETKQLKTNAARGTAVTWSSGNEAVATVDSNGLVTAVSAGTATITVKSGENPAAVDTCEVAVKDTRTLIEENIVHLKTKGTAKTYVLDYDIIGRKNAVKWKSSNPKVVSVSKGKITAKKPGTAVITAAANGVEDTVSITVDEYTPTIALKQSEYTLYTKGKNNQVTLKAVVDGPQKKAVWSSSNEDVAKVAANGKVTAVGEGQTLVTATANGVAAKCWIRVKETQVTPEKYYYVLKTSGQDRIDVDVVGAAQTTKFKSKNTKIVKVDNKGNITGKKAGMAEITITANGVSESCYVYVTDCEHEWGTVPQDKVDEKRDVRTVTCDKSGLATKYCPKCESKTQDIEQPLGHQFGRWMMEVKATAHSAGLEKQVCSRCGAENTRTIPAKATAGGAGSYEKGDLVWADEFDTLNLNDWNFEYHEPGWVNAELQEYGDSPNNTYVKDGMLYIQALKEMRDGKPYYTSGRINTQSKHTFQYGRFEVRAKVPSGKGFLPAFWMMPENESYYGQWPKCGEIDIMEVHGSALDTSYSTLHFGEPHTQKQGSYTLPAGAANFGEGFHVFACEWDPGEFRFYVDDVLTYTVNDWFTQKPGFGKVAYPAPYDQPFYMILNLAVGGSWVGYPDDDAVFEENAQFVIDYVRVYQKDHYDMDVDRPESVVQLRDPDETGNYIVNGDFSKVEDLSKEDSNWRLLFAEGGAATAEISDNALHIISTNAGTVNYGVQLVQADLPMENGAKYKLSYDAWADEARTMITDISAPDRGYIRYLDDKTVELTTEKKTYEHIFDMTGDSDPNGRVEFNLGNQGSLATVHITNVRLVKEGSAEKEEKGMRPDGNYVYNGSFDEGNEPGKLRLAYWDWDWDVATGRGTSVSVNGKRELEVTVPDTVTAPDQVVVSQNPIAVSGGKKYAFSFDAYADRAKTIRTELAGNTYDSALTTEKQTFRYEFDAPADLKGTALRFLLGTPGTVYIDNVAVREDALIVNGDFSAGMLGYEVYVNDAAKVPAHVVDSLNEKDAFSIDIADTGSQDWYIQLKQSGIKLEKDKWYKLSFDAKSTVDREIMYALQRDGTSDDDWTPYSGQPRAALTAEFQKFEKVFHMDYDTDPKTVLSISMGAVGGKQISDKHTIVIDNINLEETEAQEEPPETPVEPGRNLIANGDFEAGSEHWEDAVTSPGAAEVSFADGKAVYTITNVGEEDWHIQLKHKELLKLEKGATYQVKMKLKSTEPRIVKYAFLNPAYDWYGGEDVALTADEEKAVDFTLEVGDKPTHKEITFVISMGQIYKDNDKAQPIDTPVSTIEIDDISVVKVGGETDLVENGDFAAGREPWIDTVNTDAGAEAETSFTGSKARYEIFNAGTAEGDIQLGQAGIIMEKGAKYKVNFEIASSIDRNVTVVLLNASGEECGRETISLTKDMKKAVSRMMTLGEKYTDGAVTFRILLGNTEGADLGEHAVEITNVSIVKGNDDAVADEETETACTVKPPVKGENPAEPLIRNGSFADGENEWSNYYQDTNEGADVTRKIQEDDAGKWLRYEITNAGNELWNVVLKQENLDMEKGAKYKVSFNIVSSIDRSVKAEFQDSTYQPRAATELIELHANKLKKVSRIVTVEGDFTGSLAFQLSMGKFAETNTPHAIEITNINVIKVEEGTAADPEEETPKEIEGFDGKTEIPDNSDPDPAPAGDSLIQNGDFAAGEEHWTPEIISPAEATPSFEGKKATFDITNVGSADWNIKLRYSDPLKLEKGAKYQVQMKVTSTAARTVKYSFMNESYAYYGGEDLSLEANEAKTVSYEFTVDKDTSEKITFAISMGKIENEDTPPAVIEIEDISVVKISGSTETPEKPDPDPAPAGDNLIQNGDFAEGETHWTKEVGSDAAAEANFENGKAVFTITNVGQNDWDIKLRYTESLTLEKGAKYQITMKIKSSAARTIKYSFMPPSNTPWYGGEDIELTADEVREVNYNLTVSADTSNEIIFAISMGKIADKETPVSTIEISDISVVKVSGAESGDEEQKTAAQESEETETTETEEVGETETTETEEVEETQTTETEEPEETKTTETEESEETESTESRETEEPETAETEESEETESKDF